MRLVVGLGADILNRDCAFEFGAPQRGALGADLFRESRQAAGAALTAMFAARLCASHI
ncbi:hypothetical protein [Methylocystis parvus]|uniref:hypothetical protein n=1 Tax=Methylocystis parvus TaxID=134 RepID=UPI0012B1E790|nr:hypothetical protein [Methylocystis parvus]WBK00689.1 hypothetical protein MMG94_02885 [Methylocystis parvus OBBP]